MTFSGFVARIDRIVQAALHDRPCVARLDQSVIQATWTSGRYAVALSPVNGDVAVVRFTDNGVEVLQDDQPGWIRSADSVAELALAMTRFFNGHGLSPS
jgi:predicted YcjX-like family ATPase